MAMHEHRIGARFVNSTNPNLTCVAGFVGSSLHGKAAAEEDAKELARRKARDLKGMRPGDQIEIEWLLRGADVSAAEMAEIQHDWENGGGY